MASDMVINNKRLFIGMLMAIVGLVLLSYPILMIISIPLALAGLVIGLSSFGFGRQKYLRNK